MLADSDAELVEVLEESGDLRVVGVPSQQDVVGVSGMFGVLGVEVGVVARRHI